MRRKIAIGAILLTIALISLTTCQMQFNKLGNGIALQVLIPKNLTSGGKGAPPLGAGSKSLAFGTTLTVTVAQEGTSYSSQQQVVIGGNTSIDFSFSLSSSGVYDVSAVMEDALGATLAQNTTKLKIPSGNYPVVLTLFSSLLSNVVFADISGVVQLLDTINNNPFSPTTYDYYPISYSFGPSTLTLTPVDPKASITLTQDGVAIIPTGSIYTLTPSWNPTILIVVTAADGTTTKTYTVAWNYG